MIGERPPGTPAGRRRPHPGRGSTRRTHTATVVADRPREIQVRRDVLPRPVSGPRRVLVNASLLLLLGSACAALVFGFRSPRLKLTDVTVRGASPSLARQLVDAVEPGCQTGAPTPGALSFHCDSASPLAVSLLTLSTSGLEQQFSHIPLVQAATLRATLPGELAIDIRQRQPEAAWVVGSTVFRVAADGTVLDQGPPSGLKVIVGSEDGPVPQPGQKVNPAVLRGAEELQQMLPNELGLQIREIRYSRIDGLSVLAAPNLTAVFGPPANLAFKMAELQAILRQTKGQSAPPSFVDMRYKTPYYRAS